MTEQDQDNRPHLWLEKLSLILLGKPRSRAGLIEILRASQQRGLLTAESLRIIEGALTVSEMQAGEIMVPRSQVVFARIDEDPQELLSTVIESGHSRFPVTGENPDDVIGILLAKDLLSLAANGQQKRFNLRDYLRPYTAIPESKRLNILLQEFRSTHNHLAVVYDEYGGISGIVTIEDVLEQIVGDIEDEFDAEEESQINRHKDGTYTIKALTPIEDFNERFGTTFSHEENDTIGGLVTQELGHLPKRDEIVEVNDFRFKVLNADGRRIHLLQLILPK